MIKITFNYYYALKQVERYISVGFPFFRQRHNLKAWTFIVPVAIFTIVYK